MQKPQVMKDQLLIIKGCSMVRMKIIDNRMTKKIDRVCFSESRLHQQKFVTITIFLFTSTKSTTECYEYYKHIMQDIYFFGIDHFFCDFGGWPG